MMEIAPSFTFFMDYLELAWILSSKYKVPPTSLPLSSLLILGLCGLWRPGVLGSILGSCIYSVFFVCAVEMVVMSVGCSQGVFIITIVTVITSVASSSVMQENMEISLQIV